MINPVELLRLFGKRKEFAQRHSDFYGFVFYSGSVVKT